ncbi:GTPase IMAP family member 8-like isoform X1 [Sebastes umbrosus]|uniref:GTPase IMAP family member 8-like isoform X1 n=1 Tax=Sebastes umbrosus TaxID=72105 RepID=UPI00189EAB54|nr:GTPase IMAP family member 8-like isoform X1 [Sebastes umbrosus]
MNGRSQMFAGPEPSLSQVVVLLLGERQSGKSSAGNSILGKPAFHQNTSRSSKENGTAFGIQVTVVDTPGWLSNSTTPDRVSQELCRGLTLCHPGPHVILLVLPITSTFGPEELNAMEAQVRLLQTLIWQRAMVLFTHGDKLGGLSIQEHIRRQDWTLHWLLERCGNRYQVMTNQSRASEAELTELFEKIQKMMENNMPPRETRDRMYTQLRRDVSMKEARRAQGRQEEIEMTVMHDVHDGRPGQRKQMASGWPYMPRGFPTEPVGVKPALGLVLLGRRKSGKSSAGNMILDSEEFQVNVKTIRCSVGHGEVSGWPVTVVDTPGWSLFGLANPKQVRMEISRSSCLCPERSKVSFVLAVPVGSFREKDRRAMEMFLSVLGNDVWRSTVVLFTYGGELRGRTVEKHVEQKGEPLRWVLDRCGHRHQVLDTNTGDKSQVKQLLEMVEKL